MQISHLYISPDHNFFGHKGQAAGEHPTLDVPTIQSVAGHGIRGDRFFDYRDDYKGQITFFSGEVFRSLCQQLGLTNAQPAATRRNVITKGTDLNTLIGSEFELQGVRFLGIEECRPCSWMNQALAPGAEQFLKGRGGLRAKILSDGVISVTQAAAAAQ